MPKHGLLRPLLALAGLALLIVDLGGCAGSRPPSDAPAPHPNSAGSMAAAAPDSLPQLSPAELAALVKGPPAVRGSAFLFTYVSRRARSVAVAGTFNGWVPTTHPLARRALVPAAGGAAAPDSLWYALVPVPRGRHRYKFLVDGNRWIADPANPQQSGDGSGGIASVLDVR